MPACVFSNKKVDLSGGINPAREYVLADRPTTPQMRDACNIWLEEENGEFAIRLGIEAVAEEWDSQMVWLDIAFADGRVLSYRDERVNKPHSAIDANGLPTIRGAGDARFQCIKPFEKWTGQFKGLVPETTASDLAEVIWPDKPPMVQVDLNFEMNMAVPPWEPGSLLDEKEQEIMKGEQGDFISPRYEQLFRSVGVMTIGDKHYDFSGNGLRIRRQGVRILTGFWGHCWQSAVFPSGKAFGFNTFPPRDDGTPNYNEGFVYDGSGVLKPARAIQIPWITELNPRGDNVSCVLETADGEVVIEGETFINVRSRYKTDLSAMFGPNMPIIQQAHARYRWDGEETVGMVERSSLPHLFTDR